MENKIYQSISDFSPTLQKWKGQKEKIVFTNGCFDILHFGHIDYLKKAVALGTKLIVGLNSDISVKNQNKSASRPLQNEMSRSAIMASLFFVDAVIIFEEQTPIKLIEAIVPDVLVKGSDYKPENIVGYDVVKNNGGEIITIDFVAGYSTSAIEQKIINSHLNK